jgi:hypothetical protein
MSWPETADGDVFRRLESSGFDFLSEHEIDFNIDFDDWPPSAKAIEWLEREYETVKIHPASDDFNGYVQFKVVEKLNYDLVIATQDRVSSALAQYGGVCESWGVLQGP